MPVYDIELYHKTKRGWKLVGGKTVQASSPAYIRSHKSRYVGRDVKIGGIRETKIKSYAKWKAKPRSKRFPSEYKHRREQRRPRNIWDML